MSSSNNRVFKTSDKSREIRPFLLKSVNSPGEGAQSSPEIENKDSERMKIEEDAYKKGFTDGIHAGRLKILGEIENELKLLRVLIDGIERVRKEIYGNIEADVVEISLTIARKIIYEAAEKERQIAVDTVKEAIKKASDREMLKIKINPVDYQMLNQKRTELIQCLDGIKSIIFEEDESIQRGGCLIETNQGDIDARIDSQIRVIEGGIRSQKSEVRS